MKNPLLISIVVCSTCLAAHADSVERTGTSVSTSTTTWLDHDGLQQRARTIGQSHRGMIKSETIGTSLDGREIMAMQVSMDGEQEPADRPAILLVAGIDADHLHGSAVAMNVVEKLLQRAAEGDEAAEQFLTDYTLYVVPRVNPDGTERMLHSGIRLASPRNTRPDDADRDRAMDEDGPDDLNGDGMITMMRIYDPRKADRVADPDEPRLDRSPDRSEGERPAFYLAVEGLDNDDDGLLNEDGPGGVDLNMNFMHGYEAHADGAGRHQLSEPESLALLKYALDHQTIAAVVVYGRHDTLSAPIAESGRAPSGAPNTIEGDDEAMYEMISERFVEVTGLKDPEQPDWGGSFVAWAYGQYGVPAFSTPLWSLPNPEPVDESQPGQDPASPTSGDQAGSQGGFDGADFMEEFDIDGDGELNDDERSAARDAMRRRLGTHNHSASGTNRPGGRGAGGGRGGRGARGGRGGGDRAGRGGGEKLTPSGIGDISMETMQELRQWALDQGYPVPDDDNMMSRMTPQMVEGFAKQAGIEIRRVAKDTGGNDRRRSDGAPTESDWLAYSDQQRNGDGFVAWTEIDHPDYERVEIGGWVPMFRSVPPVEAIEELSRRQTDFILDLARHMPSVELQDVDVRRLSDGLWEVKASLVNEGRLPAGTAMAKRNRRARPWVVRLDVEPDAIVTGRPVHKVWRLEGDGGRYEMRWVVEHPGDVPLEVELFSEKYGQDRRSIPLSTDATDGGAL